MHQVSGINRQEVGWDGHRLCGVALGLFCGGQLFSSHRVHGWAFYGDITTCKLHVHGLARSASHGIEFGSRDWLQCNVDLKDLLHMVLEEAQKIELASSCELTLLPCLVAMWLERCDGVHLACGEGSYKQNKGKMLVEIVRRWWENSWWYCSTIAGSSKNNSKKNKIIKIEDRKNKNKNKSFCNILLLLSFLRSFLLIFLLKRQKLINLVFERQNLFFQNK